MPNFYHSSDFFGGSWLRRRYVESQEHAPLYSKLRQHFVSLRRVATNWTFNPEQDPISIAAVNNDLSAQRRRGWQQLQRCNSRIQYFRNPFGSLFHEAVVP